MFCNKCGSSLDANNQCPYCDNNTNNANNKKNNSDSQKIYKIAILAFLIIIVILLVILLMKRGVLSNTKDPIANTVGEKTVLKENGNVSRTVMIYMVGANLESESAIATADIGSIDPSLVDLEHMDILIYTGGTEKWHNFVSNEENAIYHLTSSGFDKVKTYEKLNMGSSSTLASFLTYGYENYKNDRYDLIFYDHGGAIDGAIYDDFTNDNLSLIEFSEALEKSPFNMNNRLETVLFRTCLNGTLEVANIFDDYAYYLVASEEVTNGGGNTSVLNFLNVVTKDDTAVDYGKKYINAYDEQMKHFLLPENHPMMYSIIDLNKVDKLSESFEKYISGIDMDANYSDIVRLRASLFQFGYSYYNETSYDMVDLYSLVDGLDEYTKDTADDVLNLINEAVVYNWSSSDNFYGLSIYFPYRGNFKAKNKLMNTYKKLDDYKNYNKFINAFNEKSSSNDKSSFASFSNKSDIKVNDGHEVSLKLTDNQANDYATSIYLLFSKTKDGLYRPVYSSDNATLENGVLKTHVADNLIKVRDKSDGTEDYLLLVERNKDGKRSLISTAMLLHVPGQGESLGNMKSIGVNAYFDFKGDTPYVKSYVSIGSDKAAGSIVNPDDYEYIDYFNTAYKITDDKGNYTDNWENDGTITGYEFKLKDVEYKKATLDSKEDYYCVFKIQDIYGNIYYSDFIKVK